MSKSNPALYTATKLGASCSSSNETIDRKTGIGAGGGLRLDAAWNLM